MTEKNISINLIYWGLHHLVWVIDKLGFDYMTDWRNDMCEWQIELEKKYDWVGENQRSWGTCDCSLKNKSKGGKK